MAPSNSVDTVNWLAMIKLPAKTTANASFSMGANHQDAALIPWTTNSSITTPATYKAFPGLAELPRDTAQMRVNYTTGTMNISSRAIKNVTLAARYRFNSRNDFTPGFDAIEYVRFDAVPEETGGETEGFNINRNTLDLSAAYTGISHSTIRAAYVVDQFEHTTRATQGYKDDTARISYDLVGSQYVTLRGQYEHTKRRSINLSVEDIVGSGAQPDLRFYDEASRNRDRETLIVEVTPVSSVGLNFSLFNGKDDYQGADSTQEFGLLDNKNDGWTAGVAYAPSGKVNLGADYGRESYNALSQSRNSNPAPDPTWTDPSRNWTMTQDEKVNTFTAYANLLRLIDKTDIRASYDLMDSDQDYTHGGPRIPALSALGQFVPFPTVSDKWTRATIDVTYSVSKKLGAGRLVLVREVRRLRLRDDQQRRLADPAAPRARRTDRHRAHRLARQHQHGLRRPPVQGTDPVPARLLQLLDSSQAVPSTRPSPAPPTGQAAAEPFSASGYLLPRERSL